MMERKTRAGRRVSGVAPAAAFFVLLLAGSAAGTEVLFGPGNMEAISADADLCRDPALSTWEGEATAVWSGLSGGITRVFSSTWDGESWGAVTPMRGTEGADCSDPAVAYSRSGETAYLWVERTESGSALVCRFGEAPFEIASSPYSIETPSVAFDGEGQPIVAWAEGRGATYRVQFARLLEDGTWGRFPLTMGDDAYDILPVVFGGSEPGVHWYSLTGQDFALRSAVILEGGWRSVSTASSSATPANRLPLLYDSTLALEPGAVWLEPYTGGEVILTFDPRRPGAGAVQSLPRDGSARQLEPEAADGQPAPCYAWLEESDLGTDALVLKGDLLYRVSGIDHLSQPRIAGDGVGGLHLLVVSDQVEGGDGKVYWTYLP